jgi:hypothetical protein
MDLSTRYLGLDLRNPLVASASPLSNSVDGVRRLADKPPTRPRALVRPGAGAAAAGSG